MSDGTLARPRADARLRRAFVGALISILCLGILAKGVDGPAVKQALGRIDIGPLALALVTVGLRPVFAAARARLLLRRSARLGFGVHLHGVLVAFVGNATLPLRGGELLRIEWLARRHCVPRAASLGMLAVEHTCDLAALCLLAVVSVRAADGLRLDPRWPLLACALVAAILVAIWALAHRLRLEADNGVLSRNGGARGWLARNLDELGRGLDGLRSRSVVGACALLSLAMLAASLGTVSLALHALHVALPWYAPGVVLVSTALGISLPSAPGFVGTYHYFAAFALERMGVAREIAVSYAIVAHIVSIGPVTVASLTAWTIRALVSPQTKIDSADGRNR